MTVRNLLRSLDRAPEDIVRTTPRSTIADAVALLTEHTVRALAVVEEVALVGMLSERDITRGLHRHGAAVLDFAVDDLMSRDLITCAPETRVADAVALMTANGIRHLPVLEGGNLVGFISMRDMVTIHMRSLDRRYEALQEQLAPLGGGDAAEA